MIPTATVLEMIAEATPRRSESALVHILENIQYTWEKEMRIPTSNDQRWEIMLEYEDRDRVSADSKDDLVYV